MYKKNDLVGEQNSPSTVPLLSKGNLVRIKSMYFWLEEKAITSAEELSEELDKPTRDCIAKMLGQVGQITTERTDGVFRVHVGDQFADLRPEDLELVFTV